MTLKEQAEFSEAEIQQVMTDYDLRNPLYTSREVQQKLKKCRTTYWQAKKSGELDTIRDGRLSKHSGRQLAIYLLRMQYRQERRAA